MRYIEFGKENKDVIMLLHGGGLSWWNYREAAELLQSKYHAILPILDGHTGSDRDFTTIEANAEEIIAFIDEKFGGSVLALGGLSLGGQILLEVLSKREDICRYALVESALVLPSKLTHAMIAPAFGSCYGLIKHRWFAKMQFKSLRIKTELFEEYYRDTRGIKKQNMIAFLQENSLYSMKESLGRCKTKVHIVVGEKEGSVMKKSASLIQERIPGSTLDVLPKLYHGELSINYAKAYVEILRKLVNEKEEKEDFL